MLAIFCYRWTAPTPKGRYLSSKKHIKYWKKYMHGCIFSLVFQDLSNCNIDPAQGYREVTSRTPEQSWFSCDSRIFCLMYDLLQYKGTHRTSTDPTLYPISWTAPRKWTALLDSSIRRLKKWGREKSGILGESNRRCGLLSLVFEELKELSWNSRRSAGSGRCWQFILIHIPLSQSFWNPDVNKKWSERRDEFHIYPG